MAERTLDQIYVIGTAGHVDHGKSTLVTALTGIDPDRLAEEKSRGMTIDLGFAWLTTPTGRSIGIVDVPGHERFIKTMLAGVGGIDAALLVIAADEGPMPQTVEHLAIVDLLRVRRGAIAITKRDLVDGEWLELMTGEIRERVAGTTLAAAPILPVSARTGEGMPELVAALDRLLSESNPAISNAFPRLPIDRVFTVAGYGTVVTGTLLGGRLEVGQELTLMPAGRPARVRGLQTHLLPVQVAQAGSRVAVNVAGLAVDQVRRGDVLVPPGKLRPGERLDLRLELLASAPAALEQNDPVEFFSGAAERAGWVTLLDRDRLEPGDSGWVQIRLREPVAVVKGDRFIIRRASPSATIGGGEIVDPHPVRHRRFRPEVLTALATLQSGTVTELIEQSLANEPREMSSVRSSLPASVPTTEFDAAVEELTRQGALFRSGEFLIGSAAWTGLVTTMRGELDAFHRVNRLSPGMPREHLRGRLHHGGSAKRFDAVVRLAESQAVLADDGATLRLPTFAIRLSQQEQTAVDRFLAAAQATPFAPPSPAEFGIDPGLLNAAVVLRLVVAVSEAIAYHPDAYRQIESRLLAHLGQAGSITMAGYRDLFGTSRKYAQATLEYLDQQRLTRRVGDERVLARPRLPDELAMRRT